MLTRKDYKAIADAMLGVVNGYSKTWDPNLFRAYRDVANALADYLQSDNPRFDRERFLKACRGVNET